MKTLGQYNLVIVVLSAKYLHSTYCMTELHALYQNAKQERQEFLNRIIPLVLKDARIGTWRDRAGYAEHWEREFKAMEQHLTRLGEEDLTLREIFIILGIKPDLPCIEFGGSFCFVLEAQ